SRTMCRRIAGSRDRRAPAVGSAGVVVTAGKRALLLYEPIVDGVVRRSGNKAFNVLMSCDLFRALEHDHEGAVLLQHKLEIEIHLLALLGIALSGSRIGLLGDLGDIPRIAPRERFGLCIIGVIRVAREAIGK